MPRVDDETPMCLKPYLFHGLDLTWNDTQAVGDCPFCGKERKLYIGLLDKDDGKHFAGGWNCKVCALAGNVYTFLSQLYKMSAVPDNRDIDLAVDRGFISPGPVVDWGLRISPLTGEWIVPAYNADGKISQLYAYLPDRRGHKRLTCTTGTSHALMGVNLYVPSRPVLYLTESLWDAMALREVLAQVRRDEISMGNVKETELILTGNEGISLLSESNVLAVPGCNVFNDKWAPLLEGKIVYLLFHSDHPSKQGTCAGHEGMKRVSRLLSESRHTPAQIHYINWGEQGHDPDEKAGYDLRDMFIDAGTTIRERIPALTALFDRCLPAPQEWLAEGATTQGPKGLKIDPLACTSYTDLLETMKGALEVRQSLEDAFSVVLAVLVSTEQTGNQLFLQLIAPPGSAKTDICDGLLMSDYCHPLEHITGFISGMRSDDDNTYSLLDRIDGKMLITPEADLMMKNPKFDEIMAQLRRIFDGSMVASYRNRKKDLEWTGLRTPWVMAGTPEMLNIDQSRLGDRFIRVIIDPPSTTEERKRIQRRVSDTAWESCGINRHDKADVPEADSKTDGIPSSNLSPQMLRFRRTLAGYANHLRADNTVILKGVRGDNVEWVFDRCELLAELTAVMRARPDTDYKKHRTTEVSAELPTRLTHQFVRLARCLAAVLNKELVDEEVVRRVTKVALDTSKGTTLDIVRVLYDKGTKGCNMESIIYYTHHTKIEEELLLSFMRRLSIVQIVVTKGTDPLMKSIRRWRLHPQFRVLYEKVTGKEGNE